MWPAFTSTVTDAANYAGTVLDNEGLTADGEDTEYTESGEKEGEGDEEGASSDKGTFSGSLPRASDSEDEDIEIEEDEAEEDDEPETQASPSAGMEFPSRSGVVILAGMFKNKDFATDRYDDLQSEGYPAMIIERKRKGAKWYYVVIGIYSARKEAMKNLRTLKKNVGYSVALRAAKRASGICLSGC